MKFSVVTIHPEMFVSPFATGVVGRATHNGLLSLRCINPRDFATDKHRSVDDTPYGGGAGMVMKCEPMSQAIEHATSLSSENSQPSKTRRIFLSPGGAPLTQATVTRLAQYDHLVLVCGRYEGLDQRVIDLCIDEEISLGDFVLSGGELAAMTVIDAVSRLVPEVLGKQESLEEESFSAGLLEYPQYTRPPVFRGIAVPDVLQSGHHTKVSAWRHQMSLFRTATRRFDLWRNRKREATISKEEKKLSIGLRVAGRTHVAVITGDDATWQNFGTVVQSFGLRKFHRADSPTTVIEAVTQMHGCPPRLVVVTQDMAPIGRDHAAQWFAEAAADPFTPQLLLIQPASPIGAISVLTMWLDRLFGSDRGPATQD